MDAFVSLLLMFFNLGLTIGLILGGLLLLRLILLRLLRPQQRVILWMVAWILAYLPSLYQVTNYIRLLPITFRDLIVPRTSDLYEIPAYLPEWFEGAGAYNLALPGGAVFPVRLSGVVVFLLGGVWIAGMVYLILHNKRTDDALRALAEQGTLLPEDDPVFREEYDRVNDNVEVKLCAGLPTSFVVRGSIREDYAYTIYLQDDLPRDRMHLVLRHEFQHIRLKHCYLKWYATVGIVMYWWNPLVWLGHRYFCQDMELACDEAVFRKLDGEERKEYAKTLVELGSGRQLWESALSFGECDAAARVKAAVAWKPRGWWVWGLTWCLTLLVMLFFLGGPDEIRLGDDIKLYYQRHAATQTEEFMETARAIALEGGAELPVDVTQAWVWSGDNNSGWLFVQTGNGEWYGEAFVNWSGRHPYPLPETAEKMDFEPYRTEATRIL